MNDDILVRLWAAQQPAFRGLVFISFKHHALSATSRPWVANECMLSRLINWSNFMSSNICMLEWLCFWPLCLLHLSRTGVWSVRGQGKLNCYSLCSHQESVHPWIQRHSQLASQNVASFHDSTFSRESQASHNQAHRIEFMCEFFSSHRECWSFVCVMHRSTSKVSPRYSSCSHIRICSGASLSDSRLISWGSSILWMRASTQALSRHNIV